MYLMEDLDKISILIILTRRPIYGIGYYYCIYDLLRDEFGAKLREL